MRILVGTYEIAGLIHQYKSGFEALGHQVTTTVFEKVSWYNHEYDYILKEEYVKGRDNRQLASSQYFQRFLRKIRNKRADSHFRNYIFDLIDQHDLIIIFWHPFIFTYEEYEYIKRRGKKLVCAFVGSDARCFPCFRQEFDVSHFQFPESPFTSSDLDFNLRYIRNAEKFSDVIYSLPDQAGLQLRPYRHLQLPFDISIAKFKNSDRRIPKILHAPSVPYKKGTDIIEKTLEDLKKEGVAFEFVSIRDLPHPQVLELLTDSDVLIDELVVHGPGVLSFEAMASGCAVATRYFEDSPDCFRPPIWSIKADNIHSRIKELLTDNALRQRLINEGREYVVKRNSAATVTANILSDVNRGSKADYFPEFLIKHYSPGSTDEINKINNWTKFVKDCNWYKDYIPATERGGLKF